MVEIFNKMLTTGNILYIKSGTYVCSGLKRDLEMPFNQRRCSSERLYSKSQILNNHSLFANINIILFFLFSYCDTRMQVPCTIWLTGKYCKNGQP